MPKNKDSLPQAGPVKNPFIVFNPPLVDARQVQDGNVGQTSNKTPSPNPGDGPPIDSQAAATLGKVGKDGRRKPTRPGDSINMFMREADDQENAIRQYLLKRRTNWFYRIDLDEGTDIKLFCEKLQEFIEYVTGYLDLKDIPTITIRETVKGTTFATWSPNGIEIAVTDRHPMDIFRSVAHEMVHQKQHEEDSLTNESGETGSEHENEANALAGIIMRNFAKNNPKLFELESVMCEGLFGAMFGKKTKDTAPAKKSKPNALEVLHAKAGLETQKHTNRLETIAARVAAKNATSPKPAKNKKEDKATDDEIYDTYETEKARYLNHPDVKAKIAARKKGEAEAAAKKRDAEHADWVATQKKFPNRKNPPGTKSFSDILTFKSPQKSVKESICLLSKSNKAGISYGVLSEVYSRGLKAWNPKYKMTQEQYAFNRVNSFIAGGKARELDKDLEGKK